MSITNKCSINVSCYYFLSLIKQDVFQRSPSPMTPIEINLLLPSPRSKTGERETLWWLGRLLVGEAIFLFSELLPSSATELLMQCIYVQHCCLLKWGEAPEHMWPSRWGKSLHVSSLGVSLKHEHVLVILFTQHLIHSIFEVSGRGGSSFETSAQFSNFETHVKLGGYKELSSPCANLFSALLSSTCPPITDMVPLQ